MESDESDTFFEPIVSDEDDPLSSISELSFDEQVSSKTISILLFSNPKPEL